MSKLCIRSMSRSFFGIAGFASGVPIFLCAANAYAATLTSTATLLGCNLSGCPGIQEKGTASAEVDLTADTTDGLPGGATYTGTARASTSYGTLRTFVDVNLNNYAPWSYNFFQEDPVFGDIEQPGFAGSAGAGFVDTFTVNAFTNGFLRMSFDVAGSMTATSAQNGVIGTRTWFNVSNIGQGAGGWHYFENLPDITAKTIVVDIPYIADSSDDLRFSLSSDILVNDGSNLDGLPAITTYDASAHIDFFNTATLTEIIITDESGDPVQGASLTAGSGTIYPVSPLNAVPVPAAVWLFGSGLLGMIGISRRKKAA